MSRHIQYAYSDTRAIKNGVLTMVSKEGWSRKAGSRDPDVLDRMKRAWRMRRDGFDYDTIAEKLNVSVQTAHRYVQQYRGEMVRPDAAQFFDEYFADLRNLRVRCQPGVLMGDPQAIRAALAVNESARKMLGLDAPVKADVTVTELSEADRAFAEMLREEAARNAVERAEAPSEG
jgi:hypothetical protein